jgi:hypothetical protein
MYYAINIKTQEVINYATSLEEVKSQVFANYLINTDTKEEDVILTVQIFPELYDGEGN